MLRSRLVAALVLAAACGGGDDGAAGDDKAELDPSRLSTSDTGGSGTEGDALVPGEASDLCAGAPSIGAGVHYGTLRGRQPDLEGACGDGGPDSFFVVEVPRRADVWLSARGIDFVPRIGVLPGTCAPAWADRGLMCTEGVGAWLLDLAAGSRLVVSVGIDPADPAIEAAPPAEGVDPLDFRLDVELRDVLGVGVPCEPATRGRCGVGTACLPAAEGPAVCTVLAADTCATAEPISIDLGVTEIEIPRNEVHTDAHAHRCGGARHPERVLAVTLPITNDPPRLSVHTDVPGVGLALRGEDCEPTGELACAIPPTSPASLTVDVPPAAGRPLMLFVELPPPAPPVDGEVGEEPPIVLQFDVTTPG